MKFLSALATVLFFIAAPQSSFAGRVDVPGGCSFEVSSISIERLFELAGLQIKVSGIKANRDTRLGELPSAVVVDFDFKEIMDARTGDAIKNNVWYTYDILAPDGTQVDQLKAMLIQSIRRKDSDRAERTSKVAKSAKYKEDHVEFLIEGNTTADRITVYVNKEPFFNLNLKGVSGVLLFRLVGVDAEVEVLENLRQPANQ